MTQAVPAAARVGHKRTKRALVLGTTLILALGIWSASGAEQFFSYLLVVAASILPTYLWVKQGRRGVPILPAMGLLSILYYAFPIIRGGTQFTEYSSSEVLEAAATVAMYLVLAALAARATTQRPEVSSDLQSATLSGSQMRGIVLAGLLLGTTFLAFAAVGALYWLGSFFGVARAVALTSLTVACYLLGVARGLRFIVGREWAAASGLLVLAVAISWSSLFLVSGLLFLLASGVGYVTTRGKVPWIAFGLLVMFVSVLHAGKAEMRERYWQQSSSPGGGGLLELPAVLSEWFELGLKSYAAPSANSSALDRASLLHILLRVERLTPDFVDYLRGETYGLLPGMLVPRFLAPDKTTSQAGMDLLNIRYGLLSQEGVERTAVGWGLIAEAYANFGLLGVAGIGLLVGLGSGALTRWSARGAAVSVSTLMAISAMAGIINLEQDLAGLVTSLLQSAAAVLIFAGSLRIFFGERNRGRTQLSRGKRLTSQGSSVLGAPLGKRDS